MKEKQKDEVKLSSRKLVALKWFIENKLGTIKHYNITEMRNATTKCDCNGLMTMVIIINRESML